MLQKLLFLLACIFVYHLNLKADSCTYTLSGSVIDLHDNSALDLATIYLIEIKKGVVADSSGEFEMTGLCAGTYTCVIEHLGCAPDTQIININRSLQKIFYLEHHAEELAEIIALSTREEKLNTSAVSGISEDELNSLKGKDLASLLTHLSGVRILKTGSSISKPVIHGLYGDRVSIINNGITLESQSWGTEHAPEIDPFAAREIKVIKGAGSLEYTTRAIGGMIIMEPASLPLQAHIKAGLNITAQSNGWNNALSAFYQQGFQKKWVYRIQGTYKRAGDLRAPGYVMSNTGLQEGNFNYHLSGKVKNWYISTVYSFYGQQPGILSASHIGNITDLQLALAADKPLIIRDATFDIANPKQQVRHQLAQVRVSKVFTGMGNFDINMAVQSNRRREYDIRRGGRSEIPALDMRLNSFDVRPVYHLEKTYAKGWHYETKNGVTYQYQFNYNNPETGIVPLIPDYLNNRIGIFHTSALDKNNFLFEAGMRYEWNRFVAYTFDRNNLVLNNYSFHSYAVSLGAKWLNKAVDISTNISSAIRNPNASELFSRGLHHGLAVLEFGDPALKSERSIKWTSQFLFHYKKFLEADITVYVNAVQDFIYLQPDSSPVLTIRGAFPAFHYDQTNALLYGLDVTVTATPLKWWKLTWKNSFVRGKNVTADDWLIYMPSDLLSGATTFFTDWKKLKNLHFTAAVDHVLKQKRVPVLINDFKEAPAAYTLLNFRAGATVQLAAKHQLGFSLSVENALNKSYRDYLNRFRYYTDETGINFIVRLNYIFG